MNRLGMTRIIILAMLFLLVSALVGVVFLQMQEQKQNAQLRQEANGILEGLREDYQAVNKITEFPDYKADSEMVEVNGSHYIAVEDMETYGIEISSVEDIEALLNRVYTKEYSAEKLSRLQELPLFVEQDGKLYRAMADGVIISYAMPVLSAEKTDAETMKVRTKLAEEEEGSILFTLRQEDGKWKIDLEQVEK